MEYVSIETKWSTQSRKGVNLVSLHKGQLVIISIYNANQGLKYIAPMGLVMFGIGIFLLIFRPYGTVFYLTPLGVYY